MQENVTPYVAPKSGETRYRVDLAFTDEHGIFHRHRKQGFKTAKDAASWARKLELVIRTGGRMEARQKPSSAPVDDPRGWTVARVWELVREYLRPRRKPNTIRTYESLFNAHIKHRIGAKVFASLRSVDVAPIAALRAAKVLVAMIKNAHHVGAIPPAIHLDVVHPPVNRRKTFYSAKEVHLIHAALPDHMRGFFMFLLGTATRLQEAAAVTRRDVTSSSIRIDKQWSPITKGTIAPKGGSARIIPLSRIAREAIASAPAGGPDDPIFRHVSTRQFQTELRRVGLRLNIGKPVMAHALRATAASLAVQGGASMEVVSKLLGHADVRITAAAYAHMMPEHLASGFDVLDNAIFL